MSASVIRNGQATLSSLLIMLISQMVTPVCCSGRGMSWEEWGGPPENDICNGIEKQTFVKMINKKNVSEAIDLLSALSNRQCYCYEAWEDLANNCSIVCFPSYALDFITNDNDGDEGGNRHEGGVDNDILYSKSQRSNTVTTPQTECIYMSPYEYYAVRTCPMEYEDATNRSLCEDDLPVQNVTIETTQAVTDVTNGISYRNIYCATCNQASKIQKWRTTIGCQSMLPMIGALNPEEYFRLAVSEQSSCVNNQYPVDFKPYRCRQTFHIEKDRMVTVCNVTGQETFHTVLKEKCDKAPDNRLEHVVVQGYLFKNIYCLVCNMQILKDTECRTGNDANITPQFTYLFGYGKGFTAGKGEGVKNKTRCRYNEWKDPKEECRPISCTEGKLLGIKDCKTAMKDAIRGLPYRLSLLLTPTPHHPLNNRNLGDIDISNVTEYVRQKLTRLAEELHCSHIEMHIGVVLQQHTHAILYPNHQEDKKLLRNIRTQKAATLPLYVWTNTFMITNEFLERDYVENMLIDSLVGSSHKTTLPRDVSFTPYYQALFIDQKSYDFISSCDNVYMADNTNVCNVSVHKYSKWSRLYAKLYSSNFNISNFAHVPKSSFVQIRSSLTCRYVQLSRNEIQQVIDPFPVPHVSKIIIRFEEYTTELTDPFDINQVSPGQAESFYVCLDLLKAKNMTRHINNLHTTLMTYFQYGLTIVCVSASLVCLMATVITYSIFPDLRCVAGCNTLGLSLSLMMAQILLFIATELKGPSILCTTIGIMTHYSWLVMFTWTFLCCLQIFQVFVCRPMTVATGRLNHREANKKKLMNFVVSLTIPGLVVVLNVVTNMYIVGEGIGYGHRSCAMDSPHAINGPLFLVVTCNAAFFVVVVCKIWAVRRLQHNVIGQDDRRDVITYIKLSTLTGMFWLLVMLGELLYNDIIRCFAIVANGCQGVFLFFSFVLNRRVLELYKSRFNIGSPSTLASVSIPSTSTMNTAVENSKPSSGINSAN